MNKGRKATQEERVEIVAFCIENDKDYGLAMEKYGVSYQQIYLVSPQQIKNAEYIDKSRQM
jgi:transposase-like protein